jgi:hypothetical protein
MEKIREDFLAQARGEVVPVPGTQVEPDDLCNLQSRKRIAFDLASE